MNPSVYPPESALARDLFYEDFNAFGKAWVLYLAGFLAILLFGFSDRLWGYAMGMVLIRAGFLCHSVGFGTRWLIADRAPVSNMYESLVFMGWGAIAIGLIPEFIYRKRFLALSAGYASPIPLPRPSQGSLPARAGSPLAGRVSHPLDSKRNFMESSHSSNPNRPAEPGRTVLFIALGSQFSGRSRRRI